jgi:hypothetical protein
MALNCLLKLLRLKGEVITRPFALQQPAVFLKNLVSVFQIVDQSLCFHFLALVRGRLIRRYFVPLMSRGAIPQLPHLKSSAISTLRADKSFLGIA